jgi:hypothetical protein
VLGDNPIYGYSHFNQHLSEHFKEAHDPDSVMATLRRAEEVGITAWQNTLNERPGQDLTRYREEGGKIQWLCLSAGGTWLENPDLVFEAAKLNPIGMAPHGGGVGARCLRESRLEELKEILKRIRDTGVMVGISAHDVELIQIAEDEDWDVDYYMTALYNLAAGRREFEEKFGHSPMGEIYLREHRDRMCEVIRKTDKPCIAFKVLAAGRLVNSPDQIRSEFEYALKNIKPTDTLLIGMYQKWNDQLGENAAIVSDLCSGDLV